jgi:Copine/C2 domain
LNIRRIENTLSPRWITTFDLDYEISQNTRINVGVWDEVRRKGNTSKNLNKPMGSALFEVGEVLGARGNTKAKKLRTGGTLFARITTAPTEDLGKIHLKLQGHHLKNVDGLFGKSDPFFILSSKENAAGGLTWYPVYRSEPIMNNLNPIWPEGTIDVVRLCHGDLHKPILLEVLDWDKKGKHTLLGKFETSVQSVLSAVVQESKTSPNTSKAFKLMNKGKEAGQIIVTMAQLDGYMIPTMNDAAPPEQNPSFVPVPLAAPARGDDVPAFGEALDRPPPTFQTATAVLSAAAALSNAKISESQAMPVPLKPYTLPLPPPIAPPMMTSRPKFTDYLMGGCELELTIAIDFTGSNGDPRKPGTLHYRYPDNSQLNDYEKAITAVGGVIARYDSDQKFSVFGFGAKYGGVIQHCFQVGNSEELDGISGVLDAYRGVFRTGLTMSGPTVFSEVIDYAAATSRSKQEASLRIGKQSYKVLLILTDGEVTDIAQTKRSIHAASDAPLSIVIVGIGHANFGAMQDLDDFQDNGYSTGRDIVQFVPFSQHAHDRSSLTRATLEEIPDQMVDYFTSRGITPLPPITTSQISLNAEDPTDEDIDLSLDVSPDGEISLMNYDGISYDDTKYNTLSDYCAVAPLPAPTAPYQRPSAPFVPYGQYQQPTYVSAQPVPVQPQVNYFHVQVPPNVTSGMQLQITNPKTQQPMIVTVPNGVSPGGTFPVAY